MAQAPIPTVVINNKVDSLAPPTPIVVPPPQTKNGFTQKPDIETTLAASESETEPEPEPKSGSVRLQTGISMLFTLLVTMVSVCKPYLGSLKI